MKEVAVIGGGAAGCFAAVCLKRMAPGLHVSLYEAADRPMKKLAVTGGGRCNLTNSFEGVSSLAKVYPRGERLMKRALRAFGVAETLSWFEAEGVRFVLQEDHCYFPASQDAMEIVRTLGAALRREGVTVHAKARLEALEPGWTLRFTDGKVARADAVIVTTGGAPKGIPFLDGLGLDIVPPVPSLFTFTLKSEELRTRMGLVVPAELSIPGTKFRSEGALLLTDWGLSGPAVLKLSSYAARELAERGYEAPLHIKWLPETDVETFLGEQQAAHPQKQLVSTPGPLPRRLWEMLCARAGLRNDIRWAEMGRKSMNRLAAVLSQDAYRIEGRAKFREEFVTCGGVSLSELDLSTLESRRYPGLFFAGEVMDVDAVTGGFNLQAAWTTGYLAANGVKSRLAW